MSDESEVMKNYLLSFFFFFFFVNFSGHVNAQNLLPNSSFEENTSCPANYDQVDSVLGWFAVAETPDYFNVCSTISPVSVPSNIFGYQQALDGDAYCGMICYYGESIYREYIGTQLTNSLIIGEKYFVSFYVSHATGYYYEACNKLGCKLSTVPFIVDNIIPDNHANFFSDSVITDTTNWILIKGSFIADSEYNYIAIGNFFDNEYTDTVGPDINIPVCYYYIDAVCLSIDTLSCYPHDGLDPINENFFAFIYPNPFATQLQIQYTITQPGELAVYDALGRKVKSCSLPSHHKTFQLSLAELPAGIYLVAINSGEEWFTEKVVKQ